MEAENMEAVIKVGGSIAENPESLKRLCRELEQLSQEHRFLIVPGGGPFADLVRNVDKEFGLSDEIAHKMAILAMDQYGLLISDLMSQSITIKTLEEAKRVPEKVATIILPSSLMFHTDSLKHAWDVTSDSIAAHIAELLDVKKLILIKDVDGLFTHDPKKFPQAKLILKITADELRSMKVETCVDGFLPDLIKRSQIECYIVNRSRPNRVRKILKDEEVVCTRIVS
jgi:hypothetical protein